MKSELQIELCKRHPSIFREVGGQPDETCMVCENWTDALVMCYPDDFQDEEETK